MTGVKWTMHIGGRQITQFLRMDSTASAWSSERRNTQARVLFQRDYDFYLRILYDKKKDEYCVMEYFDGFFMNYPRGKTFRYGFDSFTLQ